MNRPTTKGTSSANSSHHHCDKKQCWQALKRQLYNFFYVSLQGCKMMRITGTDTKLVPTVRWIHSLPQKHVCHTNPQKHWHNAQTALIQPIQLTLSLSHNISNEWNKTHYYLLSQHFSLEPCYWWDAESTFWCKGGSVWIRKAKTIQTNQLLCLTSRAAPGNRIFTLSLMCTPRFLLVRSKSDVESLVKANYYSFQIFDPFILTTVFWEPL